MCSWSIRGQILGFRGAVADVENKSTAERDHWQSEQSQVMRGAKRYGGVGSQSMFCRLSMRLSCVVVNSMTAAVYRKRAISASQLRLGHPVWMPA